MLDTSRDRVLLTRNGRRRSAPHRRAVSQLRQPRRRAGCHPHRARGRAGVCARLRLLVASRSSERGAGARPGRPRFGGPRREDRARGRLSLPWREASPRDRHRPRARADPAPPRRADGGHEPRGDGLDHGAHPRPRQGADHPRRRAQDEARDGHFRLHHGPASGPGPGRGHPRRDPEQRPRPADLPGWISGEMTLLALQDVHTHYGEAHILQGVSLTLEPSEVVALIGRNGAGKTTTLRTIMGIAKPTRGSIRFRGEDITHREPHEVARRGIAWIPEERRVLPNLTVLQNLQLGMLGARTPDQDAVVETAFDYFPRLRERKNQPGRLLSGGEQQMLAIARGLVARPELMLVDEPTEGLAPLLVESLTEILGSINKSGTSILLVEQTLDVALSLAHRLYVMDQGQVQFTGTPDELRRNPAVQQRFLGV